MARLNLYSTDKTLSLSTEARENSLLAINKVIETERGSKELGSVLDFQSIKNKLVNDLEIKVTTFLRKDDYIEYLANIAQFLNCTITKKQHKKMVADGKKWLTNHNKESVEYRQVKFLIENVLPLNDLFNNSLLNNASRLQGMVLPSLDENIKKRVIRVTNTAIEVSFTNNIGQLRKEKIFWTQCNAHKRLLYLAEFANYAFVTSNNDPAERRIFLTFQLLNQNFNFWKESINGLDDVEVQNWEALKIDFGKAKQEYNALQQWLKIKEAMLRGEEATAYKYLQQLKISKTSVAFRYREEISKIEEQCAQLEPSHIAGEMVRHAQKIIDSDAQKAITLLIAVLARYGNVNYPEKSDIPNLRQEALLNLAAPILGMDDSTVFANFLPLIATTGKNDLFWRAAPYYKLLKDITTPDLQETIDCHKDTFLAMALLEFGDWQTANELLYRNIDNPLGDLPIALQLSVNYAHALNAERYPNERLDHQRILESFRSLFPREEDFAEKHQAKQKCAVLVAAMLLEYEIISQKYELDLDKLSKEVVGIADALKHKRRFTLNWLSWLLEQGKKEDVILTIDSLLANDESLQKRGFNDDDKQFFSNIIKIIKGTSENNNFKKRLEKRGDQYLKLAVSALANSAKSSYPRSISIKEGLIDRGILAGSAYFDLLLLESAELLEKENYGKLARLLNSNLKAKVPTLNAYLPSIVFLRAGVSLLKNFDGVAKDRLQSLGAATVTNKGELFVARCLLEDVSEEQIKKLLASDPKCAFWYCWLKFSQHIGLREFDNAKGLLEKMKNLKLSISRKRFIKHIEALYNSQKNRYSSKKQKLKVRK